ncbi:MAG: hypothetical protein ABTA16_00740 [Niallia sp.]
MQVVIPLICTVLGFIIAAMTFGRNRDKDIRQEAASSAVIGTKLDSISAGVESIRIDMKANEKSINDLSQRMVRVEESSKQAHKRLDDIKKETIKNENN